MRPTDPGNQQHEHLNRGKQTLLLDVHAPASRAVLDALIDSADVVMQNFAHGMAERYGLGYEQVSARKPDIIYFSLSAYGYGGPMGGYRGFEGNAQAATGLMHRFGGDGPPLGQPYLLDDYGTGIRGAFADRTRRLSPHAIGTRPAHQHLARGNGDVPPGAVSAGLPRQSVGRAARDSRPRLQSIAPPVQGKRWLVVRGHRLR